MRSGSGSHPVPESRSSAAVTISAFFSPAIRSAASSTLRLAHGLEDTGPWSRGRGSCRLSPSSPPWPCRARRPGQHIPHAPMARGRRLVGIVDGIDAHRHAMGEERLAAAAVELGQCLPEVLGRFRQVARPGLVALVDGLRVNPCPPRPGTCDPKTRIARDSDLDAAVDGVAVEEPSGPSRAAPRGRRPAGPGPAHCAMPGSDGP